MWITQNDHACVRRRITVIFLFCANFTGTFFKFGRNFLPMAIFTPHVLMNWNIAMLFPCYTTVHVYLFVFQITFESVNALRTKLCATDRLSLGTCVIYTQTRLQCTRFMSRNDSNATAQKRQRAKTFQIIPNKGAKNAFDAFFVSGAISSPVL